MSMLRGLWSYTVCLLSCVDEGFAAMAGPHDAAPDKSYRTVCSCDHQLVALHHLRGLASLRTSPHPQDSISGLLKGARADLRHLVGGAA
ncbi:hypothetical protein ACQKWADRAFT_293594 [Trichoderma austrokoningii]